MIALAATVMEGRVLRILFRNPDSLYTVARFQTAEGEITATGAFLELTEGDRFELTGEWTQHPKYGRQFAVLEPKKVLPDTAAGIESYLSGGLFKGIGKKLARRLVQHFGEKTLEVLLSDPDRVSEVPGVGPAKQRSLVEALGEYSRVQQLALLLQGHGVSLNLTMRIHRRYGDAAIKIVRENPYRLAREVDGIGFLTADDIARKLGTAATSPERLKATLQYILAEQAENAGHAFLPQGELLSRTLAYLNRSGSGVRPPQVHEALQELVGEGWLVQDEGGLIYRRELYEAEAELAEQLKLLLDRPAEHLAEDPVPSISEELGVTYAPEQADAIRRALVSPVTVITGGPGTGKSTVLRGVLAALRRSSPNIQVLMAAPTGRAARRMAEITGEEARTIHRLLGYNPAEGGFAFDRDEPLRGDLLVVDEFSMVDLTLASALFDAVPPEMRVLLVGDVDQLPSVGVGSVLADLIGSGVVPMVRLIRIYRQGSESRIILNAHRVNQGQMPDLSPAPDFEFVRREDPAEAVRYIRERALAGCDAGATLDQITVLTPMRKTETGALNLNKVLQDALNPAGRSKPEVNLGSHVLRRGDKVMQRKNNYEKEVFNGSLGQITAVDEDENVTVAFEDGQRVVYKREELDQLTLGYACTIHKAQGSEYSGLLMIPVTMQHASMLQRNLLYTALTRAKEKVVLVGTEQAVQKAVRTATTARRYSRLGARLRGEAPQLSLPPLMEVPPTPAPPDRAAQAAAIYAEVADRRNGTFGWAAVRVSAGGEMQTWSGATAGGSAHRLLATAAGLALSEGDPDAPVVLCATDADFLEAVEGHGPADQEVESLRETLSERVWRSACVDRQDAMAVECLRLATAAVGTRPEVKTDAQAARRAAAIGTLGNAADLPELLELLSHDAPAVRKAALRALGKLEGDERCLEPLNDLLLRETAEDVRTLAEALLKRLLQRCR